MLADIQTHRTDTQTDRQTDRKADRNTPLPYQGAAIINKTKKVALITMYCHLRPPDAIAFLT